MLWWGPVRNIALGKAFVYAVEPRELKGKDAWVAVEWVFLSGELGEEAAPDIFISVVLTQPDSPSEKLMRRNGLVEEPTGRIYTCHRHLNPGLLNLQSRPRSLPPLLPRVDGKWPVCVGLTPSPSASRHARPPSAAGHFPCSTLSARVDECFFRPHVKYRTATSSMPALVTLAISQREGKTKRWGKLANK